MNNNKVPYYLSLIGAVFAGINALMFIAFWWFLYNQPGSQFSELVMEGMMSSLGNIEFVRWAILIQVVLSVIFVTAAIIIAYRLHKERRKSDLIAAIVLGGAMLLIGPFIPAVLFIVAGILGLVKNREAPVVEEKSAVEQRPVRKASRKSPK